ncbi:MAG: hypothetical protein LBF37_02025 [Rickettsiales bacterium]|nr:hypothetical protein [Rickettsiales bacterium]
MRIPGLVIKSYGENCLIRIHKENINKFAGCTIHIAEKCKNVFIEIDKTSYSINDFYIHAGYGVNQKIKVGRNFSCWGCAINANDADCGIIIGNDCMFSRSIVIWCGDGHSILDKESKKILNPNGQIILIDDHVWVGEGVKMTKSAHIHRNSVAAIGSVISKDYKESNVILAGNPARIIKHDIDWDRRNPYTYIRIVKSELFD